MTSTVLESHNYDNHYGWNYYCDAQRYCSSLLGISIAQCLEHSRHWKFQLGQLSTYQSIQHHCEWLSNKFTTEALPTSITVQSSYFPPVVVSSEIPTIPVNPIQPQLERSTKCWGPLWQDTGNSKTLTQIIASLGHVTVLRWIICAQ